MLLCKQNSTFLSRFKCINLRDQRPADQRTQETSLKRLLRAVGFLPAELFILPAAFIPHNWYDPNNVYRADLWEVR